MYDNYFSDGKYNHLKARVFDILNGDDVTTDIEEFAEYIHQCYENLQISAYQYDDLMRNLNEMRL